MINFINQFLKKDIIRNILIYGAIGVIAIAIDYFIFITLFEKYAINRLICNIIAMNISSIFSFVCNTYLNFKQKDHIIKRFFSYYIMIIIGMGLSSIILSLWNEDTMRIGKIVATVLAAIIQFILNYYITYSKNTN